MVHSVVVQNFSVPAASPPSLLMSGLTPGALYRLQAAAVSGPLRSRSSSLEGRTSESVLRGLMTQAAAGLGVRLRRLLCERKGLINGEQLRLKGRFINL